jgi:hypothetical protein
MEDSNYKPAIMMHSWFVNLNINFARLLFTCLSLIVLHFALLIFFLLQHEKELLV